MPDDHAASSLASFRPAFTCLRSNSFTLTPRAALRPLPPPLAQLLLLCSMPFLPPALPPLPPPLPPDLAPCVCPMCAWPMDSPGACECPPCECECVWPPWECECECE